MTARFVRLAAGDADHERLWGAVGLTAFIAGVVWVRLFGLLPLVCPFRALTGLPCPTCGASRGFASLVSGHPFDSLRFNPLVLPVTVAGLLYVIYAVCTVALGLPRLRLVLSSAETRAVRWTALVATAAFWGFMMMRGIP
jgi:hypothetical protein